MLYFVLLILELALLYFLSKRLTNHLYRLFKRISHKKERAYYLLAVFFLPGTFVHEVSHFLAALFFLVPVGELELIPEFQDTGVRLGSVAIGKTDPLRRFLIGVAPFLLGTAMILVVLHLTTSGRFAGVWWLYILIGYLVFQIGNTMFASKKDLEGALALFIFFAFILLIFYFLGVKIPWNLLLNDKIMGLVEDADYFLMLPVILDSLAILVFKYL